ncbi:hypothetical protein DAPPUDRAFT_307673 [Daphnia pulex]|uniref:Uncharacterized protein n=1 Tax=Daphnia pulex TaxID=6669 RepID=E9H3X3_DAPPU|nr:hypothetical protein DAPPUDRAFT_307673 [Daphnia pulex]|eukprot:EFX73606.1 hypothetical protein DAPPUDRAFT_307673 [Daphnia pulex]
MACRNDDTVRNRTLSCATSRYDFRSHQEEWVLLVISLVRYESNYTSPSIEIAWNESGFPTDLLKHIYWGSDDETA